MIVIHGIERTNRDVHNFCQDCSKRRSIFEWCRIRRLIDCNKLKVAFDDRLDLLKYVKSDFE